MLKYVYVSFEFKSLKGETPLVFSILGQHRRAQSVLGRRCVHARHPAATDRSARLRRGRVNDDSGRVNTLCRRYAAPS